MKRSMELIHGYINIKAATKLIAGYKELQERDSYSKALINYRILCFLRETPSNYAYQSAYTY